jgi:hypothetical protein
MAELRIAAARQKRSVKWEDFNGLFSSRSSPAPLVDPFE